MLALAPRGGLLHAFARGGEDGFVKPVRLADGKAKVFMPEMLVGMLLEMGAGSRRTPKGGLKGVHWRGV